MNPYVFGARGCDDSVYALVDMTDSQAAWLQHVIDIVNARSVGGCQPEFYLKSEEEAGRYERERATEPIEEHP